MFSKVDWFSWIRRIWQSCMCEIVVTIAVVITTETLRDVAILTECVDIYVQPTLVCTRHRCSDIAAWRHSYLQHTTNNRRHITTCDRTEGILSNNMDGCFFSETRCSLSYGDPQQKQYRTYRVFRAILADCDVVSRSKWICEVPHRYCAASSPTCVHSAYVVVFTKHNRTVACHSCTAEARSVSHVNLCHSLWFN